MGVSPREPLLRAPKIAKQAEDAGFEAFYILDSQLIVKDAIVTLALCAAETDRILLGTGVTNPLTRDITVVASAFSALKEISGGRAILGIGNGGSAVESIGMKGAKIAEMEEVIRNLRSLLAGETIAYNGMPAVTVLVAQGEVPIYLSATQPKMLGVAGRLADGVVLMGSSTPAQVQQQIDTIHEAAREAGRDPGEIVIDLWQTISVNDDRQQALDDVKSWVASQSKWWLSRSAAPPPVASATMGDEVQKTADAYNVYEHLSLHAKHKDSVSDEFADAMAIAGSIDRCAEKLSALAQLPVQRITLSLLSGGRLARLENLTRVVERVNAGAASAR
jgi:5,10-methylenetetrahydromethanopterin reductase